MNHQIYENTCKINSDIVLHRILDEGFATYVSYIFHDKKIPKADELHYTQKEFNVCEKNDTNLINFLKENFEKNDSGLARNFANRTFKFNENLPGGIGYYLGFRIVEEYVKNNGKNSWKEIYKLTPEETLKKSKIFEKSN